MRILFLSHYFFPEGNAPATRVHELGRRWARMGHEVTVVTCDGEFNSTTHEYSERRVVQAVRIG